jgi:ribosomal protein S18 acetylase RimI-like enzyme
LGSERKMRIRRAVIADIPIILGLIIQLRKIENSFSKRISCNKETKCFFEKVLPKILNDKDHVFFVAEDKKIVGLVFGWKENIHPIYKNEFVGYIADVIVDKDYRGEGVGKKLVNTLEAEFKKMGLKETKLLVLKNNEKAHSLWKKIGYEELYVEMRKDLV